MSKIMKDTHVYIPCPACGKTERVKLKWAEKHKSLKCAKCKKSVDLRAAPSKDLIARTATALASFEKTLDTLHAEAKKFAKAIKPKNDKKNKKMSKSKKAAKKRPARTAARRAAVPALPPVDPASL